MSEVGVSSTGRAGPVRRGGRRAGSGSSRRACPRDRHASGASCRGTLGV